MASIVFFGTPEFAVPALEMLIAMQGVSVPLVVTQSDKPSGRGKKLTAPPIKVTAEKHNIQVLQPLSLSSIRAHEDPSLVGGSAGGKSLTGSKSAAELATVLNSLRPIDAFVVIAYGKLIPLPLLDFATHGCINVHPSALPHWRGPAPIHRALFSGETKTAISIMQLDDGMDTGPVYAMQPETIGQEDTFGDLHDRFSLHGAELLTRTLTSILDGSVKPKPQVEEGACYAAKWERADAMITWSEPAEVTLRRIKTSNPIPGARTTYQGKLVKILRAHSVGHNGYASAEPGKIVCASKSELVVSTGSEEHVSIDELQLEGRKRLLVSDVLRGGSFSAGESFQ